MSLDIENSVFLYSRVFTSVFSRILKLVRQLLEHRGMRHRRTTCAPILFLLAIATLSTACSLQQASPSPDEVAMDDQAILSTAVHYRDSPAFVQVNDTAYASALGGGAFINLYVSTHAFPAYATIESDAAGTGVVVPEGTLIVREVLDEAGNVKRLTLMAKGPPGYNPDLGDFWFGVTEPDGTPVVENGAPRLGRLQDCYGCHLARASDDFLFGVPADNRKGLDTPEPPSGGGDVPLPPPPPPPPLPPLPPAAICGDFVCEAGESCLSCEYDCGECDDDDDDDDDYDDDDYDDDDYDDDAHG